MEFIKKQFPLSEILLIYKIGSRAYGVENDNSDTDLTVVINGYSGMNHVVDFETRTEYYIYSKELWIKKMELDSSLANLFLIFPDEVIGNTPLHIDEEFVEVYENYQNRNFATIIKKYLEKVIAHFETYLSDNIQTKMMWHLFRIEEQVLRFISTGEWTLNLNPETIEKIQVYKSNYHLQNEQWLNELNCIIEYLKEVQNHEWD
ncbi:MAG TPA: hypothetical protein PLH44_03995 [Bacilli bacterium]|nr:hypothetical protein [Bacilli bacterium]